MKKTVLKEMPIFAGMKFSNGKTVCNKIHKVGVETIELTYDVEGDDCALIGEKTIKRVIIK